MTKIQTDIISILNDLEPSKRIEVIERIGKRLRQQNSIAIAKEVSGFKIKNGIKPIKVDEYPT